MKQARNTMLAGLLFVLAAEPADAVADATGATGLSATALPGAADSAAISWSALRAPDPFSGGTLGVAKLSLEHVRVMVRCVSAQSSVDVRFFVDNRVIAATRRVTWQFDGRGPESSAWHSSPNGRSLLVPPALQSGFIARLKSHNVLTLYLNGPDGRPHEVRVPLLGSARAITQAVAICYR